MCIIRHGTAFVAAKYHPGFVISVDINFTDSRLIHVIPYTVYPFRQKIFIKSCPPFSRTRHCKVRKSTGSRPHFTIKISTVRLFHPYICGCSRIINFVSRIIFHTGINHIHRLKSFRMQILIQPQGIAEIGRIKCKNSVPIHIVNIHPDDITGNIFGSEGIGNFLYFCFCTVRKTTLVIPQGPPCRHRNSTCQFGKPFQNFLWRISVDNKNAEKSSLRFKFYFVWICEHFRLPC